MASRTALPAGAARMPAARYCAAPPPARRLITARGAAAAVGRRRAAGVDAAESFNSPSSPREDAVKVVGCGGIGIDYLASVASFPKPDDKLRTQALQVQGGGNAGNALTAVARLGLKPTLLSKVGDDPMGELVISELEEDGIDTSGVLRAQGFPTPFTYIIVDREGGTRTCIHTPGDPLRPEELPTEELDRILQGAKLVYFDGRLTEGALLLAERARETGIKVLVEAERLRPNLDQLLLYADFVTTSAHFPHDWTGEQDIGDAMIAVLSRLPSMRFLVTTLGTRGSVMLTPCDGAVGEGGELPEVVLQDYLEDTFEQIGEELALRQGSAPVDAIGSGNVPIRSGVQVSSPGPMRLRLKRSLSDAEAAKQAAIQAARRAARNNADSGNHEGYVGGATFEGENAIIETVTAMVTVSSAAIIDKEAVFDTTGAGDAFNGSLIYGLVTGMSAERTLQLGSLVAAANCTALGARQGLPRRDQLRAEIL
eukprot:jgi/Tetstr1/425374/TSEL_015821.t1